jgi:hypothetical protein
MLRDRVTRLGARTLVVTLLGVLLGVGFALPAAADDLSLGSLGVTAWPINQPGFSGTIAVSGGTTPYTISSQSGLPPGLSASVSGSTVSLTGTPTATGTFSSGSVTVKDALGITATQTFSVVIVQPPAITSASSATFGVGVTGSFTVTTTGYPSGSSMVVSESGRLPAGVSFTNNQNGTATISGTPKGGTKGTYQITIKASNGFSPNATQGFTLYVKYSTSLNLRIVPSPATVGRPVLASAVLTPGDSGGTVSFSVAFDDGVPVPVPSCQSLSLHADAASCAFTPPGTSGPGTYTFSASYGGDANYVSASGSASVNALEPTTLSVRPPASPRQGSAMTVTATVDPAPNSGTVAFLVQGPRGKVALPSSCSPAALQVGVATCTFTPSLDGTYTITAVYSGSTLYTASSNTVTVRLGH